MALVSVKCPYCGSAKVVKFLVNNLIGRKGMLVAMKNVRSVFQLDYKYRACEPGVKFRVLEMIINCSGIRDISHVLHISADVVIDTLKKENGNQQVNLT